MTRKTSNHPSVIKLFNDLYDLVPQTSHGTYNGADPTAFFKGSDKLDTRIFGRINHWTLSYADCTWGVEWEIRNEYKEVIANFYDTRDKEGILWREPNYGFLRFLKIYVQKCTNVRKSIQRALDYNSEECECPSYYK